MHIGAVVEQQLDRRRRLPEHRRAGRGLAAIIDPVRVGAMLEQHADRLRMTVIRGQDEQRVARSAREVHRHSPFYDGSQLVGLSFAGEVEDSAQEVQLLLGQILGHDDEATRQRPPPSRAAILKT